MKDIETFIETLATHVSGDRSMHPTILQVCTLSKSTRRDTLHIIKKVYDARDATQRLCAVFKSFDSIVDYRCDRNDIRVASNDTLLTALVRRLVPKGADPNSIITWDGGEFPWRAPRSVLSLAITMRIGCKDVVECLLAAGADPNWTSENGSYTPLPDACRWGYFEIMKMLLEAGADPHKASPLVSASHSGDMRIIDLLLSLGIDPNTPDKEGYTALMVACRHGHLDVVKKYLACGAHVNTIQGNGWSAVFEACNANCPDILRELLSFGGDVNTFEDTYGTPLTTSCYYGYEDIVAMLLEAGACTAVILSCGRTALSQARWGGHDEIVNMLITFQR